MNGLSEMRQRLSLLKPTEEETKGYARLLIIKGIANNRVKSTESKNYFSPRIHLPKKSKNPRFHVQPHIDLGCGGLHLHLDCKAAEHFIKFIERRRR